METCKNTKIIIVKEKNTKPNNVMEAREPDQDKPYSRNLFLFFLFLQFFLSFDFGFIPCKTRRQRIIIKCLTMMPALIILLAICFHIKSTSKSSEYGFWLLYAYSLYGIMAVYSVTFNRQNSLCVFLENLFNVDKNIQVQKTHCDCKIIGLSILIVLMKIFVTYTNCALVPAECVQEPVIAAVTFTVTAIVDLPIVFYFLIFHFTHRRMISLKNIINDCFEPKSHQIYKSLVDGVEKCIKCFDVFYMLTLLNKIPVALIFSLVIIKETKMNSGQSVHSIWIYFYWLFQYLIIVIVPAVVASLLAREVDKIKIILHDKRLLEHAKDSKADAIKNFLLYIKARPMKFYIFSVIPLNCSFPLLILNGLVMYLIMAVQLSHIY